MCRILQPLEQLVCQKFLSYFSLYKLITHFYVPQALYFKKCKTIFYFFLPLFALVNSDLKSLLRILFISFESVVQSANEPTSQNYWLLQISVTPKVFRILFSIFNYAFFFLIFFPIDNYLSMVLFVQSSLNVLYSTSNFASLTCNDFSHLVRL